MTVNLCVGYKDFTTWLTSDQHLTLGCSLGSGYQYRWQTDSLGSWSDYSSTPTFDFAGHTSAGNHLITAQAYNPSTHVTTSYYAHFNVANSQDTIGGPSYVTDKHLKIYYNRPALNSVSDTGKWYEEFPPDTTWYVYNNSADSMAHIWPAGQYSVILHWDSSTSTTLRRSSFGVQVCNPQSGCGFAAPQAQPSPVEQQADDWSLFGGGLWIASPTAAAATRLYDLLGNPDATSVFGERSWFDATSGGTAQPTGAGSSVGWQPLVLGLADARAFTIQAGSSTTGPVDVALALDPDIGPNAADDRSGYDSNRGLVYVFDGDAAVGYMIRDSAGADALATVIQYGIARMPPRSRAASLTAMRSGLKSLMTGQSDVMLLLAPRRSALAQQWTFVAVRAASVSALQARADSALAVLTR